MIFIVMGLVGCSGSSRSPAIPQHVELSDAVLHERMQTYLKDQGAPLFSRYLIHRADMNSDGFKDAIVLMRRPYGYWCDTHGCRMLVFKAGADTFEIQSIIEPVREPVYLTFNQTNGWRDIMVNVAGRSGGARDVILQHDGRSYPRSPAYLPERMPGTSLDLMRIFYNEGTGLEWDNALSRKLRTKH